MSLRVRSLQFQALSSRGLPLPMLPLASSSPAHPGNAPESCPPRTGSRAQRRCPPRDPARQESPFLCAHGHGRHSPRPCPQGPSHSCFCGQAPATVSGVPRGPLPGPLRAAPPSGSLRWRRHQHPRFLLPTAASGNLRFSHRAPHDSSSLRVPRTQGHIRVCRGWLWWHRPGPLPGPQAAFVSRHKGSGLAPSSGSGQWVPRGSTQVSAGRAPPEAQAWAQNIPPSSSFSRCGSPAHGPFSRLWWPGLSPAPLLC